MTTHDTGATIKGMGRRGPAKKPRHLRVVSGTDRADRIDDEVVTSDGLEPVPADGMRPDELVIWHETIKMLKPMGLLSSSDATLLTCYCRSVSTANRTSVTIDAEGLYSANASGVLSTHPAVTIRRLAMADSISYATQMGLTPAARLRLNAEVTAKGKKENPFDRLKNDPSD